MSAAISNLFIVNKELKVIDLFAGLGGLRVGFDQAAEHLGFRTKCVFTSEIKPHAITTYKLNFPSEEVHGDITQIKSEDIPDFDVLLAGFPCQPFSAAGKGLGFVDTRGTLFFDIERILSTKQPEAFILENVEGLVSHDKVNKGALMGRTLSTILTHLEDLNYKVSWKVFDASNFGLPQKRKRIYIVGTKKRIVDLEDFQVSTRTLDGVLENSCNRSFHVAESFTDLILKTYSPGELLGKQVKDKRGGPNNIHSWDIALKGEVSAFQKLILEQLLRQRRRKEWALIKNIPWADGMPLTLDEILTFIEPSPGITTAKHRARVHKELERLVTMGYLTFESPKKSPDSPPGYNISTGKLSFPVSNILDPSSCAPTLVATDVTRISVVCSHGRLRRLTPREGFRLFGFPDEYKIPEGLKYSEIFDLLGNSVTLNVVKMVSERVVSAMN